MKIQVLGVGCDKCDTLYERVTEAAENLGIAAEIEKVEDLMEIVKLGVLEAPALAVDGKVLLRGRVPKTKELEKLLQKNL